MVDAPRFADLASMEASTWLAETKQKFVNEEWPPECVRCRETEKENNQSIRTHAIAADTGGDYLQVGGVLDNLCNAACQTCSPSCSTKIGSLSSRVFPLVNNTVGYWYLPQQRIQHLDINGGEPSYSKNYKRILANLPPNLKTLRLNTNCNTVLSELTQIAEQGIDVTVTVSFDGIGSVHEFIRWPIKWDMFYKNLMTYKSMPVKLNLWTTVSKLNQQHLPEIIEFARSHGIDHDYAYLKQPEVLAIDNTDTVAFEQYMQEQRELRGIV